MNHPKELIMSNYTLGLDFGTESARVVLVDVATGETVATAAEPFPDGVIGRCPGYVGPAPPGPANPDRTGGGSG